MNFVTSDITKLDVSSSGGVFATENNGTTSVAISEILVDCNHFHFYFNGI